MCEYVTCIGTFILYTIVYYIIYIIFRQQYFLRVEIFLFDRGYMPEFAQRPNTRLYNKIVLFPQLLNVGMRICLYIGRYTVSDSNK